MTVIALTREVSPRIAEGEVTHLERQPVDVARAREQHAAYESALRALGVEVRRLPPAPHLPDSVFVEDTAVVLEELAVLCRPGAESRAAEVHSVEPMLRELRPLHRIEPPGTLDGGDVLRAGHTLFVGVGDRTNAEGARQLASIVASAGYDVVSVSFTGCLHLKTGATLVADGLALINPDWVAPSSLAPLATMAIDPSEPFAANALRIGDVVLFPAEFPRTRALLEAAGIRVHTVPAGELAKVEGGLTCCSVLVTTE